MYAVNELNQITNAAMGLPGFFNPTVTVSGATTGPATNVTVNGVGANLHPDGTFDQYFTATNGRNVFVAVARDAYGRQSTNVSAVNVQVTNSAYTYDLNGNLISDGTRNFAYDDENELISVWQTNVWREDYVYDGKLRRRITRQFTWNGSGWQLTNEVHYVYDGNVVIQERDQNNLPVVTYTRGEDLSGTLQGAGGIGGLLARTDMGQWIGNDVNANAYYISDGRGNIIGLVNTNGWRVAHYKYDPYGNLLAESGPLASANQYRFSSKEWNDNASLYYYGFRFYDPNLQRWPNRDPLQELGGLNLYGFVANNPINEIDPFGLWQITIQFGVGLGFRFTIGNNGGSGLLNGQWNEGAYVGVGEGFSFDVDIYNRGCHEKGSNWGAEGSGDIGLGPHVEGEAHVGPDSWWNVNAGLGDSPLGASYGTEGATVPTVGFGESGFIGVGG